MSHHFDIGLEPVVGIFFRGELTSQDYVCIVVSKYFSRKLYCQLNMKESNIERLLDTIVVVRSGISIKDTSEK